MKQKVSIIIAAYNEEKYIIRCLDSLINQTYDDIEIIVVDDGSIDGTKKKVESIIKKDNRIKYFYKKNEGQGIARNYGIKKSSGDFVTFVDADDYVEKDMYEKMINKINEYDADTVIVNWSIDFDDLKIDRSPIGLKEKIYTNEEIDNIILPNVISTSFDSKKDINISGSAAKTLYKREIIISNNIFFTSERKYTSEDMIFNIEYYLNSNKVYILDENLYHYCQIDGSFSHSYKSDLFEKSLNMYSFLKDKLSNKNNNIINIRIQKAFYNNVLLCILQESKYGNCNIKNIRRICNNADVKDLSQKIKYYKMPIKKKLFSIALRLRLSLVLMLMCKLNNK